MPASASAAAASSSVFSLADIFSEGAALILVFFCLEVVDLAVAAETGVDPRVDFLVGLPPLPPG